MKTGQKQNDAIQREILPIPNVRPVGSTTYDAKDPETSYPPIRDVRPPPGAPNVLVILLDDVGFGAASAFGGPCRTPVAERLAAAGLRYNRFHTTALCSPTRQALLTGRNHHSVGMGGITEIATGAPGYCSVLPNTASPLARTLKRLWPARQCIHGHRQGGPARDRGGCEGRGPPRQAGTGHGRGDGQAIARPYGLDRRSNRLSIRLALP